MNRTPLLPMLLLCATLVPSACDDVVSGVRSCVDVSDCVPGERCVESVCVVQVSGDAQSDLNQPDVDPVDTVLSDSSIAPDLAEDSENDGVADAAADAPAPDAAGCAGCLASELCCDDRCVDPTTSAVHCGACGATCFGPAGIAAASCSQGQCVIDACDGATLDCNRDHSDGCEVDGSADPAHCGACDNACSANSTCSAGACSCPNGVLGDNENCGACGTVCDTTERCEVDQCVCLAGVLNDDQNCGGCGVACTGGSTCAQNAGGSFVCGGCAGSERLCGGVCVDVQTSDTHCGDCNIGCPSGLTCVAGACELDCSAGTADCDGIVQTGCETNLTSDNSCGISCGTARDCGGFGDTCNGSQRCRCDSGDVCRPGERCEGLFDNCVCSGGSGCGSTEYCCNTGSSRVCADPTSDVSHCGGCNIACAAGQTCVNGTCQ